MQRAGVGGWLMADDEFTESYVWHCRAAIYAAGGDFRQVGFAAARILWLFQLIVEERALVDKIEAAMKASVDIRSRPAPTRKQPVMQL